MKHLPASVMAILLSLAFAPACADQVVGWPRADETAPTVTATTPANRATDVALNAPISATFSEAMDPATINGATFSLAHGASTVPGDVIFVGVTALFAPSAMLDPNTEYTATITSGARDLAGNALASSYAWSFTTGELLDTIPPRVVATSPVDGASSVGLNTSVTATFNEAMDPQTISGATFTLLDGTTPVSGTVTYSGVTASFNPSDSLDGDTTYTARIGSDATDLAGNGLAGDYVWTFTTGTAPDTTRPQVISTTPADGATAVALNVPATATFSEAMDAGTISTATFTLSAGATPVLGRVTYSGGVATFTPLEILDGATTYTARISSGASDLAGNGLAADYVWTFTTGASPDVTPPQVSSTVPPSGATSVAPTTLISATFTEAMRSQTFSTATFTVRAGTTPVAGTVSYSGTTATFDPAGSLAGGTTYTATIHSAVTDVAGNELAQDYVWSFETATAGDTTRPLVTATTPAMGATAVALNAPITATFSEAMDSLSISTATFTLYHGTTPVSGTVSYSGVTAIFDPAGSLASATTYTATIQSAAKDLAGNELAQDYVWSFTTGSAADSTRPMVSATTPANGATAVALNAPISATFSEAMNPLTISTATFTVLRGATPVSGTVTYSGVTATFHPAASLASGSTYTVTIQSSATDLAGNELAQDYVWSFTTGTTPDTTPPLVSSTSPESGATKVALNALITATFSEAMDPLTISAATFTLLGGATPVSGAVTYVGVTATFDPTGSLEPNTTYTATVSATASDLAGNTLANAYAWTFTTGQAADVQRPTVTFTVPPEGATDVAVGSNIAATFSEAMDPTTISAVSFTVQHLTTQVAGTVTYSNLTATFNPTDPLAEDTTYTATITTAARDLAGNALLQSYTWSFTTAAPAGPNLEVLSTDPTADANDVCPSDTISATFSVPPGGSRMDPATIDEVTFSVTGPGPASTPVAAASVELDAATGLTATFTPLADLDPSAVYTATLMGGPNGVRDLAGNPLASDYSWEFTTVSAGDCLPPTGLGAAETFGVFGGSAGVTNSGLLTVINGDIGTTAVSTAVTGLHDQGPGCTYTETPLNVGVANGLIYTAPPPPTAACPSEGTATTFAIATQGRAAALAAYNDLVAQPGGPDPGAGNLANLTLAPGVYTAASGSFMIQGGDLTLDAQGNANAVWVFQMATTLTVGGPGAAFPQSIILAGGAQAKNVFWQVGSAATINAGGGGTMVGTIICQAGAAFSTAGNVAIVTLNGRVLSLGASVTLVNTVINVPAP